MAVLVLLILGIIFLLLKQQRKIQKLKSDTDKLYRKALEEKYKNLEENAQQEFQAKQRSYNNELSYLKKELEDFRSRRDAINEAIRRERELIEKEDFYKIQLTQNDIEDIKLLDSMRNHLCHKEVLPKVIWESIARRPVNEMIKRVVGQKVGGIYKITYIPTGEAYIGRTVNFKDRWQAHIQTALGMEKVASSTLHTHMARNGIWNYSFEILEEVPKDKQSEREKFYIDLYGTQKQLNMKAGG
jgi:group I intron endonuclease|nr:MAG TPA: intron associated endonuclease [Caudoviricetes sp.]